MGRRKKGERPKPRVINHCGTKRGRLRVGGKAYWLGIAKDGRLSEAQLRRAEHLIALHEHNKPDHAVYVIGDGHGNWKIGMAASTQSRLVELQTGNACQLFIAHQVLASEDSTAWIEAESHTRLADKRIRGEWFRCMLFEAVDAVNEAWQDAFNRTRSAHVTTQLAARLGISEQDFS